MVYTNIQDAYSFVAFYVVFNKVDGILLFFLGTVCMLLAIFLFHYYKIKKESRSLGSMLQKIAGGELPKVSEQSYHPTLQPVIKGIREVVHSVEKSTVIAENIASNQLNGDIKEYQSLLKDALLQINSTFRASKEDAEKRNWISKGLASFSETLRFEDEKMEELAERILVKLAKKLNAQRGVIYYLNHETEQHLDLLGSYACVPDLLKEQILLGEGLLGKSAASRKKIIVNNVPESYMPVKSGLGEALPSCLAIIPIKIHDEVFGVIELARFQTFQDFEIEFVEKLSEDVAALLKTVQISNNTDNFLKLSQQQGEELKQQRAELEYNMNKLQITQSTLKEQKETLEKQNHETLQSIRYAKHIQHSILSTEQQLRSIFPESLLIYKPKDIVSGDFFWVSEQGDLRLIAVIDCTGHGVPGAFMSLIGNDALNVAINQMKMTNPAQILNFLNQRIWDKLNQSEGLNSDGMDLGVCAIKKEMGEFRVLYAGAKHRLYAVQQNNLISLSSDKIHLGGKDPSLVRSFTNQALFLYKGDVLYLATDGYIDQANPQKKRFGSPRFEDTIKKYKNRSMKEQEEKFLYELDKHQQDAPQRDDITLLGVKL